MVHLVKAEVLLVVIRIPLNTNILTEKSYVYNLLKEYRLNNSIPYFVRLCCLNLKKFCVFYLENYH